MTEHGFPEPENAIQTVKVPAAPRQQAANLPYSNGRRVGYGLLWAGWTGILITGGLTALFGGQILGGLLALALGAVAGRYDYRIWTWRARRLLFFVIA